MDEPVNNSAKRNSSLSLKLLSERITTVLLVLTSLYLVVENGQLKSDAEVLQKYVVQANAIAQSNKMILSSLEGLKIKVIDVERFQNMEGGSLKINEVMAKAELDSKENGVVYLMPDAVFSYPDNIRASNEINKNEESK